MKRSGSLVLIFLVAVSVVSAVLVLAQSPTASSPFFVEVNPRQGTPGIYDVMIPNQVMDKSREDLADLRLYDNSAREIPYALRIRRQLNESAEIAARLFNQVTVGSKSETSVDLGDNAGEHNEIEVDTIGRNFRRRVEIEGSDTGSEWRTLTSTGVIFRFESQNKSVDSKRIDYPTSRYRFLRVRVFPDELTDDKPPFVNYVKVMMALREKGELANWGVPVPSYQLLRNQGAPASAWTIDLGGFVPCDRLTLEVADESFSRPFQLEVVDDPQNIRSVTSGELTRRVSEQRQPLVILFEKEERARKLRLVVTDYSNPMLTITSIMGSAPARQLIFELKDPVTLPLHLFFGNQNATPPHYDFEKQLSAKLTRTRMSSAVGSITNNPEYRPEPLPLTERIPWLIYLVLGASSVALALILFSLARTALKVEPTSEDPSPGITSS